MVAVGAEFEVVLGGDAQGLLLDGFEILGGIENEVCEYGDE